MAAYVLESLRASLGFCKLSQSWEKVGKCLSHPGHHEVAPANSLLLSTALPGLETEHLETGAFADLPPPHPLALRLKQLGPRCQPLPTAK